MTQGWYDYSLLLVLALAALGIVIPLGLWCEISGFQILKVSLAYLLLLATTLDPYLQRD